FELIPLMLANPMGKEHVTTLLDELLALGAEHIAALAAADAAARLTDVPGEFKAAVVVADDLKGGWTNRYDWEFTLRFGAHHRAGRYRPPRPENWRPPKGSKFLGVLGAFGSSGPASARAVQEAMLTAAYRIAFIHRRGNARTLREMLVQ